MLRIRPQLHSLRLTLAQARSIVLMGAFLCFVASVHAADTPVGLWKSIDDQSGKPRSLVRLTEVNGELRGVIEKVFPQPGEDPAAVQTAVCKECKDERRDKPIVGLTIIRGLKKNPHGSYDDGEVLDPENGKRYQCRITVLDGGAKLEMRGYIGTPLLGRTQTWVREK